MDIGFLLILLASLFFCFQFAYSAPTVAEFQVNLIIPTVEYTVVS